MAINLKGWQIADKFKKKSTIHNRTILAGDAARISISGQSAIDQQGRQYYFAK